MENKKQLGCEYQAGRDLSSPLEKSASVEMTTHVIPTAQGTSNERSQNLLNYAAPFESVIPMQIGIAQMARKIDFGKQKTVRLRTKIKQDVISRRRLKKAPLLR